MEQKGEYNVEVIKRENAVLRKYAVIQKAAEEKIGCQKVYVDIAGGIEEAFILDELIFFTLPRADTGKSGLRIWKNGVLWMAVSRSEWWDRKRITAKQADGAIERLVKDGLIYKEMFLFNKQKTTHLRLNVSEFFKRYAKALDKQNPPENEGDTISKDINDLYEMMGIPKEDTPGGIPDGETGIPVKDTVSLNGNSINSPDTTLTQPYAETQEVIQQANRKMDAYLDLAKSPGIKRMARIDSILSYIGGKLRINTETKRWQEFAKFVDERQQTFHEGIEVFIGWLLDQKDFNIQYWSPLRMMEMWPQAFTQVEDTEMTRLL